MDATLRSKTVRAEYISIKAVRKTLGGTKDRPQLLFIQQDNPPDKPVIIMLGRIVMVPTHNMIMGILVMLSTT